MSKTQLFSVSIVKKNKNFIKFVPNFNIDRFFGNPEYLKYDCNNSTCCQREFMSSTN